MTKLNPWLEQKLPVAEKRASPLRYIVEVEPGTREAVKAQLGPISDLNIIGQPADRFIAVSAPPEILPKIEGIPEVVKVSADTAVWIKSPLPFLGIPTPAETFAPPSQFDKYLGRVQLSPIEVPVGPGQALLAAPMRALATNDMIVYTTDQQRQFIGVPKDNKVKTICAVADTGGIAPGHILIHPNSGVRLFSVIPFEPLGLDSMGHGGWCQACAYGDNAPHPRYGRCEGVADPETTIAIKCLSTMGFGMLSWILDATYRAWEQGARVLSLSLGGPAQGSAIDDDPESRLISALKNDMICVVAAGNEGPSEWTIGSPGFCPDALTVGAWSMTDNGISHFSSRGPSAEFYQDKPEIWERDKAARGEDMIKPDLCAPGGGRVNSDDKDEQLLSAGAGWFDPYGDAVPQFAKMKGTSMACPAGAGMCAILYDRGIIKNAKQVKDTMAKTQPKNPVVGYGLFHFSHFTA